MNVLIVDEKLYSQMQMYLILHQQHNVEIALDEEDAMRRLDNNNADIVLLDMHYPAKKSKIPKGNFASKVRKKYPKVRLIGIHNRDDANLNRFAEKLGLKLLSRPIKSRLLMKAVNN